MVTGQLGHESSEDDHQERQRVWSDSACVRERGCMCVCVRESE